MKEFAHEYCMAPNSAFDGIIFLNILNIIPHQVSNIRANNFAEVQSKKGPKILANLSEIARRFQKCLKIGS